jgi:hypothetical protein
LKSTDTFSIADSPKSNGLIRSAQRVMAVPSVSVNAPEARERIASVSLDISWIEMNEHCVFDVLERFQVLAPKNERDSGGAMSQNSTFPTHIILSHHQSAGAVTIGRQVQMWFVVTSTVAMG